MSVSGTQPGRVEQLSANGVQDNLAASPPLPPRVYLRKDELAAWLGVGQTTVEEWMRGKVIPFVKINRVTLFRADAVDRALQRFVIKAVGDFQKS